MSQFRVEKRRAEAEVTLSTGATLRGCFFLAGSGPVQPMPERVGDLLNAHSGFVPFEPFAAGGDTVLINPTHVICVKLAEPSAEAQLDAGYDVAPERQVRMLLSNGEQLTGAVRVYCPEGRDRLSDYARSSKKFRYVESAAGTFIVNTRHIVELTEAPVERAD